MLRDVNRFEASWVGPRRADELEILQPKESLMTFRHSLQLAALAVPLVFATSVAQASFNYTSSPAPSSTTFGGSTVVLTGINKTGLSGLTFIDVADVADSTNTVPPATDTTSINLAIPVAIQNVPPPGTVDAGTITINGVLAFQRSDIGGEVSTF